MKSSKEMKQWTTRFTDYHIYFNTAEKIQLNGFSLPPNASSLHAREKDGSMMCANPFYEARILSRHQITWKVNSEDSKTKNQREDSKKNTTSSDELSKKNISSSNDLAVSNQFTAFQNSSTVVSDSKQDKEVIHDFMVFALLLPNHPYSQELYNVIAVVATMFPSVTIVVGNVYEFRDMANKYLIRSFPKMLFFKSGIFLDIFESDSREASYIAGQITKWTKKLPQAIPYRASPLLTQSAVRYATINSSMLSICHWIPSIASESDDNHLISILRGICPNMSTQSLSPPQFSVSIPLPPSNLEPFLGSIKAYDSWDLLCFLLSAVYCLVRFLFHVSHRGRQR